MNPKWISVEDRLPVKTGKYLVWEKHYSGNIGIPVRGFFELEYKEFFTEIADDWSCVTHWLEGLEPPD